MRCATTFSWPCCRATARGVKPSWPERRRKDRFALTASDCRLSPRQNTCFHVSGLLLVTGPQPPILCSSKPSSSFKLLLNATSPPNLVHRHRSFQFSYSSLISIPEKCEPSVMAHLFTAGSQSARFWLLLPPPPRLPFLIFFFFFFFIHYSI